eukprot:CAMPEP_0119401094 /NCGR_PEP_ID=MMETSP1334-20130426/142197_1 /TAXON_ID=127549 /ORGANISM="Calcidiscus leptoporus, Strain RCC1130" /LENGTH=61 /DNA_ID=CAMNT_0007425003 /DNA_START=950 /DNA_END=1131 /DNA_ORIENTATION=+
MSTAHTSILSASLAYSRRPAAARPSSKDPTPHALLLILGAARLAARAVHPRHHLTSAPPLP